jgi:ADP-ribose pyrophosphatase YjhB (NUDIX family)
MRLSSSSLDMASARISCSFRSAKRFTGRPLRSASKEAWAQLGQTVTQVIFRTILISEASPGLRMNLRCHPPPVRAGHPAAFCMSIGASRAGSPLACAACHRRRRRVFLVKHSYVAGWHLPGGGVERGETLAGALARELREEGNIELTEPPVLHAVYFNRRVVAARSRRALCGALVPPDRAAAAEPRDRGARFLCADALPADTSRATRERIAEVLTGRARGRLR